MAETRGFFAGSFDPFTNGHFDILKNALAFLPQIVIAIGAHPTKSGLFSLQERRQLIEAVLERENLASRVRVTAFNNLVVDAARSAGASVLIRGLREGVDLDYEMQMAGMNGKMASDIQTVFLPASPECRFITSTLVRQIATLGGDINTFVPACVAEALKSKFSH